MLNTPGMGNASGIFQRPLRRRRLNPEVPNPPVNVLVNGCGYTDVSMGPEGPAFALLSRQGVTMAPRAPGRHPFHMHRMAEFNYCKPMPILLG